MLKRYEYLICSDAFLLVEIELVYDRIQLLLHYLDLLLVLLDILVRQSFL